MSIRTSKGDGREVVFILGATERSLKLVSNHTIGLVYESHLHVALTRAKRKIYFGLIPNNDEIHRRFVDCGYVEYLPCIKNNLSLDKLCVNLNKHAMIELLERNNINPADFLSNDATNKPTEAVDWGYHCIKHMVYYYRVILNIVMNCNVTSNYKKSELAVILDRLSKIKITNFQTEQFYEFLNKHQRCTKECCLKGLCEFPLCNLSSKPKYKEYYTKIESTIKNVQTKIQTNNIKNFSIYEAVLLVYMIQVYKHKKYADMNPIDIYNITHIFETNKNKEYELLSTLEHVDTIIVQALKDSVLKHNFWNSEKQIYFKGINEDFSIQKMNFPILGYNESDITHIIIKSDLSALNFWDVLIETLLERFLIYNPLSDEDHKKYNGKNINTYIFILKNNNFIKLDWKWDNNTEVNTEIKTEIKHALIKHFSDNHIDIYNYLCAIKDKINNGKYWGGECKISTPFEYISTKMKDRLCKNYPQYIIKIFEDFHEKWNAGSKQEVKRIIDNRENFTEHLHKKLESVCDSYLGLSKLAENDDDF